MKNEFEIQKKTARENFLNLSGFPKHSLFFPSTKTDKALGIRVVTILLQFIHKIIIKRKIERKREKYHEKMHFIFHFTYTVQILFESVHK